MKVKMKDNLILRYQRCHEFDYREINMILTAFNEMQVLKQYHGMQAYFDLKIFLKSIENKVIELVFVGNDAFDKNDNNFWLPESLWDQIDESPSIPTGRP